jgi:hypothetical protein
LDPQQWFNNRFVDIVIKIQTFKGVNMSENTEVGPDGGNKPAFPANKPENYGTDRRVNGGSDSGTGPEPSEGLPPTNFSNVEND